MVSLHTLVSFAAVAFALVVTPGPNMAYLLSRSICQGRAAGFISLLGILAGFLFYMVLAASGVTALIMAVPLAYSVLRWGGAIYLAWLAWQAPRPGGVSTFAARVPPVDSRLTLFSMGFMTNVLNPKVALLYVSLLPQFVDPAQGGLLAQGLVLGLVQMSVSGLVNAAIVAAAGSIAAFLTARPTWAKVQRWLVGAVLGTLAVRMAVDK